MDANTVNEFDLKSSITFEDTGDFLWSYDHVGDFKLEKQKLLMVLANVGILQAHLQINHRHSNNLQSYLCKIAVALFDPSEAMPPATDGDELVIANASDSNFTSPLPVGGSRLVPRLFVFIDSELDIPADSYRQRLEDDHTVYILWSMTLGDSRREIHRTPLHYSSILNVRPCLGISMSFTGFPPIGKHASYSGISSGGLMFPGVRKMKDRTLFDQTEQLDQYDDMCFVSEHAFGCLSAFKILDESFLDTNAFDRHPEFEREPLNNFVDTAKITPMYKYTTIDDVNSQDDSDYADGASTPYFVHRKTLCEHNHATFMKAVSLSDGNLRAGMIENGSPIFSGTYRSVLYGVQMPWSVDFKVEDNTVREIPHAKYDIEADRREPAAFVQDISQSPVTGFDFCMMYKLNDDALLNAMMDALSTSVNMIQAFKYDPVRFAFQDQTLLMRQLHPDLVRGICLLVHRHRSLSIHSTPPSLTVLALQAQNYYKNAQMAWAGFVMNSVRFTGTTCSVVCIIKQFVDEDMNETPLRIDEFMMERIKTSTDSVFPEFEGEVRLTEYDYGLHAGIEVVLRINYHNSNEVVDMILGRSPIDFSSASIQQCTIPFGDVAHLSLTVLSHPTLSIRARRMGTLTFVAHVAIGHITPAIYIKVKNLISNPRLVEFVSSKINSDYDIIVADDDGEGDGDKIGVDGDTVSIPSADNILHQFVWHSINSIFTSQLDRNLITLQESGFPNSKLFQSILEIRTFRTLLKILSKMQSLRPNSCPAMFVRFYAGGTLLYDQEQNSGVNIAQNVSGERFLVVNVRVSNFNPNADDGSMITFSVFIRPMYLMRDLAISDDVSAHIAWHTTPFMITPLIAIPYDKNGLMRIPLTRMELRNRTDGVSGSLLIARPSGSSTGYQLTGRVEIPISNQTSQIDLASMRDAMFFNTVTMV